MSKGWFWLSVFMVDDGGGGAPDLVTVDNQAR
jgi:hypothetical protein